MNHSYSPVIFTKSSKMMLCMCDDLIIIKNCLLPPFFGIFQDYQFWKFSKRLFRPRAQISANVCLHAASSILGGKNSPVGKNVFVPLVWIASREHAAEHKKSE